MNPATHMLGMEVEMGKVLIDQGALKMALNVLRRAGKSDVADALEESAEVIQGAEDSRADEPEDAPCSECGVRECNGECMGCGLMGG